MKKMKIEYECADGSRTFAGWPSVALQHWNMRFRPRRTIKNPQMFKAYIVGTVLADTDRRFLTTVYATIEREFNQSPPFEIIPPDRSKDGGTRYQRRCLEVLKWLAEKGHIQKLTIRKFRPKRRS